MEERRDCFPKTQHHLPQANVVTKIFLRSQVQQKQEAQEKKYEEEGEENE